jgi:hypothetical protein
VSAIDTHGRLESGYGHHDAVELRVLVHDDCVVSSLAVGGGATIWRGEAVCICRTYPHRSGRTPHDDASGRFRGPSIGHTLG